MTSLVRRYLVLGLGVAIGLPLVSGFTPEREAAIDYEKVLVTVFLQGPLPGRFGSLWATEAWMRNNAAEPIDIQQYDFSCPVPECPPTPATPPGISFRPKLASSPPGLQGHFLFVDRRFAPDVAISVRLRDLSRQSMTWGTEVPVVREGEFRTKNLTLLDIPTGDGFRQVLRVYDLDGSRIEQVNIRVYRLDPTVVVPFSAQADTLLGERLMSFQIAGPNFSPIYPGYVEVSDLTAIGPLSGTERVRIDIEPVTPGLRYWAFVAVVNNDTQHLTVISPSP